MSQRRYKELQRKHSVSNNLLEPEDKDRFDVITRYCGMCGGYERHRVIYNKPNLDNEDLALICAKGDLNYGFKVAEPYIHIGTK